MMLMLLLMLASPHISSANAVAAVDDGDQQLRVKYNNVFFSDASLQAHMKGRPSTSFVMVKSDGRAYQLRNSGLAYTYSDNSDQANAGSQLVRIHKRQPESTCPPMSVKPSSMCLNANDTCWSVGQQDTDCPNYGLCCFDGCANTCQKHVYNPRVSSDHGETCPVIESKTEEECSGAVATCWSRGVPDVDCPDFGLCCFDGCVNTCKIHDETDEEDYEAYDETLADSIDEDYDDNLDDELDDELDDMLDDYDSDDLDDLDAYGAPAAPVVSLDAIDSYGSPLADTLDIDTYGIPAADPITDYIPASTGQTKGQTGKGSQDNYHQIRQRQSYSQSTKPGAINPGRTANQVAPVSKYSRGFDFSSNNENFKILNKYHSSPLHHPKSQNQITYSSSVFKPIKLASQPPYAQLFSKSKTEAKRISRKKLLLAERNKINSEQNHVLRTLERLWKKHFGVFANL